ncbi:MAG: hypothetical protein L6Q83_13440 [Gammaproteobacteria bacterium]|nr:hypothetical protein [Gammaproteobacteria bacterium]
MPFWLSKPLYEFLPYFYVLVGVLLIAASSALAAGLWRALGVVLALGFIAVGALLWWRRRTYRRSR